MYNQSVKNLEKENKRILRDRQEEMLEMFFKQTLKPKPKYIPKKLWRFGASIFLNLK